VINSFIAAFTRREPKIETVVLDDRSSRMTFRSADRGGTPTLLLRRFTAACAAAKYHSVGIPDPARALAALLSDRNRSLHQFRQPYLLMSFPQLRTPGLW
jgi:hypothetical protein